MNDGFADGVEERRASNSQSCEKEEAMDLQGRPLGAWAMDLQKGRGDVGRG
jgi:hypothetical protein